MVPIEFIGNIWIDIFLQDLHTMTNSWASQLEVLEWLSQSAPGCHPHHHVHFGCDGKPVHPSHHAVGHVTVRRLYVRLHPQPGDAESTLYGHHPICGLHLLHPRLVLWRNGQQYAVESESAHNACHCFFFTVCRLIARNHWLMALVLKLPLMVMIHLREAHPRMVCLLKCICFPAWTPEAFQAYLTMLFFTSIHWTQSSRIHHQPALR